MVNLWYRNKILVLYLLWGSEIFVLYCILLYCIIRKLFLIRHTLHFINENVHHLQQIKDSIILSRKKWILSWKRHPILKFLSSLISLNWLITIKPNIDLNLLEPLVPILFVRTTDNWLSNSSPYLTCCYIYRYHISSNTARVLNWIRSWIKPRSTYPSKLIDSID